MYMHSLIKGEIRQCKHCSFTGVFKIKKVLSILSYANKLRDYKFQTPVHIHMYQ